MDKVRGCAILSLRAEVTACAGLVRARLDRQGIRLGLSPLDIALPSKGKRAGYDVPAWC